MPDLAVQSQRAPTRWQTVFENVLPTVRNCAAFAFRDVRMEERAELIQECVANAAVACANLVARGRADRIFATAIAGFAIRRTREGRKVGGRLNASDVMSKYCQMRRHLAVRRLGLDGSLEGDWQELMRGGRKTPVPEQAAFRIDFPTWLARFSRRNQEIALALAEGRGTNEVAREFSLSPSRVSQLRREYHTS